MPLLGIFFVLVDLRFCSKYPLFGWCFGSACVNIM